jgi:hypothetical protein
MSQNNPIVNYLKHFADSTFPVAKQRERVTFQRNVEMVFGSTSNLLICVQCLLEQQHKT